MFAFYHSIQKAMENYDNNKNKIKGIVNFYKAYSIAVAVMNIHKKCEINKDEFNDLNEQWAIISYEAYEEDGFKDASRRASDLCMNMGELIQKQRRVIFDFLEEFKECEKIPTWWVEGRIANIKAYKDTVGTEDIELKKRISRIE